MERGDKSPHSRTLACLLLGVASASCSLSPGGGQSNGAFGETQLVITGSSTLAPLVAEIGKRFEALHPGVRIDVQSGGSSRGIADVRRGLCDVGMVSRRLRPDENDLHAWALARDGVCLIVHRHNPVAQLDHEQVAAIYTGRIGNWREVGGPDAPITVVHKAEGRSTLELFLAHYRLETTAVRPDLVIGDNEQGIKSVAGNPHAIGYVSIGSAEYSAGRDVPIRLLPMGGVAASVESVGHGTFPLSRELTLVTHGAPSGLARAFLEFARSPDVHDLIREQSFVPITPGLDSRQ